ncbi:hypothetical protein BMS3Abin15_00255 [bacterium BMS3Abin15]|nr:hypothetical protein BMS3Abin15_00255 [bacterium BMS3Abin15]HDZ85637.1 hypothetical protein [Candidatus Moranbacteria bacterium]
MEFKKTQKEVIRNAKSYGNKYKVKIDDEFAMLKLYEEVGELAQAYLVYKKKSRPEKYMSKEEVKKGIAKELADVVGVAMVLADALDIDLEEAIDKKWISKEWIKDR